MTRARDLADLADGNISGTLEADGLTVDTNTLHVDSTNNRVGVGTVSPQSQIAVSNAATTDVMEFDTAPGFSRFMSIDRTTGDEKYLQIRAKSIGFALDSGADDVTIDSSGNVGIGTDSPATPLHIVTSGNTAATFHSTTNNSNLVFTDASTTANVAIGTVSGDNFRVQIASSERMRIDSSGNVGIGTDSPTFSSGYGGLHVHSTYPEIHLTGTDSGSGAIDGFKIQKNSVNDVYLWNYENALMVFGTNNAERMRIDSGGSVHVGGTSESETSQVSLNPSGYIKARKNNVTGIFDRITTDGDILQFRKDGTTVGSIGAKAGDLVIGTTITSLRFNNGLDVIHPFNQTSGLGSDANTDLGASSARFKDLYLSGGVYLGGTGSANYLDDYEEGTWTPAFYGATSVTHDYQVGRYTKVGNLVRCEFTIGTTSLSGSQTILINGLPFTQAVAQNQVATRGEFESIYLNYSNLSTARYGLSFTLGMLTIRQDNTGGGNSGLSYSDVSNTGLFEIRGSITYRTGT
jgi:hypothetical protein